MARVDSDPGATQKRLMEKALTLKPAELNWLKKTAVENEATHDERFLAVYMLGLSGSQ